MLLADLRNHVTDVTDEDVTMATTIRYLNSAIAAINVRCNAIYNTITSSTQEITEIPDHYQFEILINFVAGMVSLQESKLEEYNIFMNRYYEAMSNFETTYVIPPEFSGNNHAQGSAIPFEYDISWGW